jgi:hypothetical protein
LPGIVILVKDSEKTGSSGHRPSLPAGPLLNRVKEERHEFSMQALHLRSSAILAAACCITLKYATQSRRFHELKEQVA